MRETLLTPSNVLLFGRRVTDLRIVEEFTKHENPQLEDVKFATTDNIELKNEQPIDGKQASHGDFVLVKDQYDQSNNGIWEVQKKSGGVDKEWKEKTIDYNKALRHGLIVSVSDGKKNKKTQWDLDEYFKPRGANAKPQKVFGELKMDNIDKRHGPFVEDRKGEESELEKQLTSGKPYFARIYGFSYQGMYYDLPIASLFLVHGEGVDVSDAVRRPRRGRARPSRAPGDPSLVGVPISEFQFAENLRVWSYDKADYTIRMDVESGMLEQVLLSFELGEDAVYASGANARVAGANARASGANARVSGANARVAGANARVAGANARTRGD